MDLVGPFVELFDKYLIAPLVRRIKILRDSSANFDEMETEVGKLMARRKDEQSSLKAAEDAGQVKTERASKWLLDVDSIEMKFDAIKKEYDQGTCPGGWCVNCWSRYKSSKRSIDLKQKAETTFKDQFDLARAPSLKRGIERDTDPIENQPSTQHVLQQLLNRMVDPEIGILGVYGMGGVGKTTLAKQVNNHFSNNSCFETVIMVKVSATPNIPSIQTTMGECLGLDLSNTTNPRKILNDALKRKKFLLILDDVWVNHTIELEDVGIPHPQNHKGSKILITSRSQDACTDMGAGTETIKLLPLPKAESWNLFVEKAGDHVAADGISCFAEQIVERCEGLPLAIVTVARAMANRSTVREWANAEREMKESLTDIRGMEDNVLKILKFSFDRLENRELKRLFLYCGCCFPEDHNIELDVILNYFIGEGLLDTLDSLSATRNKGEAFIGSLKISCMLEDGEIEGTVRMHDMMRELAHWITSTSEFDDSSKFLLRTGESCKEAPQPNEWVDATGIFLFNTLIEELPQLSETCGNLTTLLLRNNRILLVNPTSFLQHVDHLNVLDLSGFSRLKYLPDSLSSLENLRVLQLSGCSNLQALPTLERLQRLQILDLSNCKMLVQQIFESEREEAGSNLRYLDVSWSGVSIPTGVISRLVKVEELRLDGAENIKWSVKAENEIINEERRGGLSTSDGEDQDDQQPSSSSSSINQSIIDVGELSKLTRLTLFSVSFKGIIISDWFKPLAERIGSLSLEHCRVTKQDTIVQALNKSQCLNRLLIKNCTGLTCVPTLVRGPLHICECEELEKLLDEAEADNDSFQRLTELQLYGLPKLERICVGCAPPNCFAQLSFLCIENCNRLKMVFTKEMPCLFNNLRLLNIVDCAEMEVIIEAKEEEEAERRFVMKGSNNGIRVLISPFPKLTDLILGGLPALVDVCNNHHILHCPLIGSVELWNCSRLNMDPLHIHNRDGLLVMEDREMSIQRWKGKVLQKEIQEI